MRQKRIPKLSHHKASDQGVARLNGRDVYFGYWPPHKKQPPEAVQSAYDATIAEWLISGRVIVPGAEGHAEAVTVSQVLDAYWKHGEQHYRDPEGNQTHELEEMRLALRPVRHLYASLPAAEFSPLKLKAVRQLMIDGYTHPKHGPQGKLSRGVVNHRTQRIVRAVKWAVSEELVPADVLHALKSVRGLERGRTEARETEPVQPVALAHVEATIPSLLPPVQAMVWLQLLTGMRSSEVCTLRGCDLETSGPIWLYRPARHKTLHRGKVRVVAIGPKAQEIIKPWLKLDTQAFLFSPVDAVEAHHQTRAIMRKTLLSCGNRKGTNRQASPKKKPGERYTARSYHQAIRKGIQKANAKARKKAKEEAVKLGQTPPAEDVVFVPHWHPHMLRHSHATDVRKRFGLEAAQVALGHSSAEVTELYAERDLALAVKVAQAMG
jgi:integrase